MIGTNSTKRTRMTKATAWPPATWSVLSAEDHGGVEGSHVARRRGDQRGDRAEHVDEQAVDRRDGSESDWATSQKISPSISHTTSETSEQPGARGGRAAAARRAGRAAARSATRRRRPRRAAPARRPTPPRGARAGRSRRRAPGAGPAGVPAMPAQVSATKRTASEMASSARSAMIEPRTSALPTSERPASRTVRSTSPPRAGQHGVAHVADGDQRVRVDRAVPGAEPRAGSRASASRARSVATRVERRPPPRASARCAGLLGSCGASWCRAHQDDRERRRQPRRGRCPSVRAAREPQRPRHRARGAATRPQRGPPCRGR